MSAVDVTGSSLLDGLPHGFLGRTGGVSHGDVAGLNVGLGSGDDPAAIAENRRRAVAAVAPGRQLVTAYQVHSAQCITVTQAWDDGARPRADAMITDRAGLVLGILTADCAPVLFSDLEARVIGAAHAGWKGALDGVTDATLVAMERLGARRERIVAAVGPCIAQPSYEVDEAFRARFADADSANIAYFAAGAIGHWHFDLEGYVAARLEAQGLSQVERLGVDTYSTPRRFFSYRRACHRSEASYGRQIALIALN